MARTPGQYHLCYQDDAELQRHLAALHARLVGLRDGSIPDRGKKYKFAVDEVKLMEYSVQRTEEEIAERAAGRRRQMTM